MGITIEGFVIMAVIIFLIILAAGFAIIAMEWKKSIVLTITAILIIVAVFCVHFYYNKTASGLRAYKTQQSELNMGLERTIRVYDVEGDLIQEYDGKFDVTYDNDRIMFDDENGKRHIIYYPTGTVIIDEK